MAGSAGSSGIAGDRRLPRATFACTPVPRRTPQHRDAERALGLFAVLSLGPHLAAAAADVVDGAGPLSRIDLTYEAPPGCPSRDEVVEELRRRVNPAWQSGIDRRSFVLHIEARGKSGFTGRLEVTRAGHETESRALDADTCRAVSSALVVFIAIALDPASNEPETPAAPSVASEPPRTQAPPATPSFPRALPPPPPPSPPWLWSASVGVVYLRAPSDAWGPRVDAQLARKLLGTRVAPALRLSWGFASFEELPPDSGPARFRIEAARASACALIALAPSFHLAPCVGFELGSLSASSRDIPQVGRASARWSAMVGLARVSWSLLPWLAIEGEVGAELPLSRPSFGLTEPVRIVYRPPSILFTASLGLAVSARFR